MAELAYASGGGVFFRDVRRGLVFVVPWDSRFLVLAEKESEQPVVRLLAGQYSAGEEGCFLEGRSVVYIQREIAESKDGVDSWVANGIRGDVSAVSR